MLVRSSSKSRFSADVPDDEYQCQRESVGSPSPQHNQCLDRTQANGCEGGQPTAASITRDEAAVPDYSRGALHGHMMHARLLAEAISTLQNYGSRSARSYLIDRCQWCSFISYRERLSSCRSATDRFPCSRCCTGSAHGRAADEASRTNQMS